MILIKKILFGLLIISTLLNISIANGDTTKISFQIEEIGSLNTNGGAIDVIAEGNTAFVLDRADSSPGGLVIVDISDPSNPTRLSSLHDGGSPFKLEKIGDYIFIADGPDGLEIIDISDLEHPVEVAQYTVSYFASDFEIVNNILYLAAWNDGLVMLNISNPNSIEYIGTYTQSLLTCIHVTIENNIMCIVNHQNDYNSMIFLDIANPTNPTHISTLLENNVEFWEPTLENNIIYVGNHHINGGELRIYNASLLSDIQHIATYDKRSNVFTSFINKTNLFLADYNSGVIVLDVSNPTNPLKIGDFDDGGHCYKVFLHDELLLVADLGDGLEILSFEIASKTVGDLFGSFSIVTSSILIIYFIIKSKSAKKKKKSIK